MARLTACISPGSWHSVPSHLFQRPHCVYLIRMLNLPPPTHLSFLNLFLFLRMGFLQTQTPTLLLALPLRRSHGFCPPSLLSSQPLGLVPTHLKVPPRQSKLLLDKSHDEPSWLPGLELRSTSSGVRKTWAWILASPGFLRWGILGKLTDFTGSQSLHL